MTATIAPDAEPAAGARVVAAGTLPISAAGSLFTFGRTQVGCSASDTRGNVANTAFWGR